MNAHNAMNLRLKPEFKIVFVDIFLLSNAAGRNENSHDKGFRLIFITEKSSWGG
jgi:hypothetical protein